MKKADEHLSAGKRVLLERMLRSGVERKLIAQRDPATAQIPLSHAQKRLWFLDQLEPESSLYNIPRALHLLGPLNIKALERTFDRLRERHEVLRTSFHNKGGNSTQVVNAADHIPLSVIDLRPLSYGERWNEAQRLISREARKPFDLMRGPLLRTELLRMAEQEHILLLSVHHIAADGWSIGILYKEISALYRFFAIGQQPSLPDLPIQYGDYAFWQNEHLINAFPKDQLNFWKRQLGSELPTLELPTDFPLRSTKDRGGDLHRFGLSALLSGQLRLLSQKVNGTPFMTLLAAFYLLLHKYTGQEDILVGVPTAGRSRVELEGLIGFFVNTLVFRASLNDNLTFRELLQRVRDAALNAFANQDVPFEKLVEVLHPERRARDNPLFQVMFVFQNASSETLELHDLGTNSLPTHSGTAKFDLTFSLTEGPRDFQGTLEYSTSRFAADTAARIARHYQTILERIAVNPDQKLADISLLSNDEQRLMESWNGFITTPPEDFCVHDLVEQQALRTPEAIAVEFADERLTYRELNERANQVAHHLIHYGVGPDTIVGICVERSPEMIIGLLAILKAGGGYLPLDPSYPRDRLALILEDAKATVLLTQERMLAMLPHAQARVVQLDKDAHAFEQESVQTPVSRARASNLAYVIYTSGSTGKPKGILMEHRPLVNLLLWQLKELRAPLKAKTLQFASLNFDVSFQEIFSTLCSGGTLALITSFTQRDPLALLSFIEAEQVERLFVPYIFLQHLAEHAVSQKLSPHSLREVITAGEQLKITPDIQKFFGGLGSCRLQNQYGPSESHVVTSFSLIGDPETWPALPPVGKPIENALVYILDKNTKHVPVGVIGELYIGGTSLARGYLHQPELTSGKFIRNPYSDDPSSRLYKTGDLARYLPDGEIVFIGRTDHQVKIRGFRIELGEVEATLCLHPAVSESVVVVHEDGVGQCLTAYFVPCEGIFVSTSDLRHYLQDKLPGYMVPTNLVTLSALPITPNGKVDRRALPAPQQREDDYEAPKTPTEVVLAALWAEVLELDSVGRSSDFFELGGHSLLAVRLVTSIRQTFHVDLPLALLFEKPILRDFSAQLQELGLATQQGQPTGQD